MYSKPSNSDWSILLMTSLEAQGRGGGIPAGSSLRPQPGAGSGGRPAAGGGTHSSSGVSCTGSLVNCVSKLSRP